MSDPKSLLSKFCLGDQQVTCIGFKLDSEVLTYFTLFKLFSELEPVRSALLFGGKDVTLKFVLDSLNQTSSLWNSSVSVKTKSALVNYVDTGCPFCTYCNRVSHFIHTCYWLEPHLNPRKASDSVAEQVFMVSTLPSLSGLTILNSGTTPHMFNNLSLLQNPQPWNVKIGIGEAGCFMTATHIGNFSSITRSGLVTLSQAVFVPELSRNLLCYKKCFERGYYICPSTPKTILIDKWHTHSSWWHSH